jgi:hypothetical protein
MLNLEQVKRIDINAAIVIAQLANIEVETDYPCVFDNVFFGLEHLSENLAEIIATWPSCFLHLDQITNLPENVARKFIGTKHALTFDGCNEFSPATLESLVKAGSLLSLGLTKVSKEQAKILSTFHGDLILSGNEFSDDILKLLKKNSNLCLPPDYGVVETIAKAVMKQ